ncbi:MAG: hypothetical protein PHH12_03195 [Candidatus Shapirobacteria bacterium]|nr:hypothetical protein [Candidatus Shapirobacteria bacterium]
MEIKEQPPEINYFEKFKILAYGSLMKIPMSMVTPITVDDYKDPESDDPLDVFYSDKNNTIFIDDGNHRYFKKKREISQDQKNYEDPDLSKEIIVIRKIDPKEAINSWVLDY